MPPIIHTDHQGEERKLGLLPPDENSNRLRAAARRLFAISPTLPRAEWTEVDYVTGTPNELRLDQKQYGQCVAASCAGANALTRYLRSGRILIASMAWIYDQINGGQDNGAIITDSQTVMMSTGAPPVSAYATVPQFRKPKMPPGVPVLKEDEAIAIDTPEEAATALISLGGFPQVGINVTGSFERFTKGGIAWNGRAPGGQANHSVFVAGFKVVDGIDCFRMVNSWSLAWGPFQDGTCYIPINSIVDGGWLHLSTLDSDDVPAIPA